MNHYTTECESCGAAIANARAVPLDVTNLVVTVPTDDREHYEDRDYTLCSECRRKVVDWVEGMDESETRADLVELELAERDLSQVADDLADLATTLGAVARGETTNAEGEE
jgi:hypothetical protein